MEKGAEEEREEREEEKEREMENERGGRDKDRDWERERVSETDDSTLATPKPSPKLLNCFFVCKLWGERCHFSLMFYSSTNQIMLYLRISEHIGLSYIEFNWCKLELQYGRFSGKTPSCNLDRYVFLWTKGGKKSKAIKTLLPLFHPCSPTTTKIMFNLL